MTERQIVALKRGLRTLGAGVIAILLTLVAGPEGIELIPHHVLVAPILTSLLMSMDKALRYDSTSGVDTP